MDTSIAVKEPKTAARSKEVARAVRKQVIGYIAGAFGLIAGLAWNDAVKALIEYVFKLDATSVGAKFAYALIISTVVGVVTFYLIRVSSDTSA